MNKVINKFYTCRLIRFRAVVLRQTLLKNAQSAYMSLVKKCSTRTKSEHVKARLPELYFLKNMESGFL